MASLKQRAQNYARRQRDKVVEANRKLTQAWLAGYDAAIKDMGEEMDRKAERKRKMETEVS